jgi:putative Holliday junction resolvase
MKLLGVDFGSKRIGLALGDSEFGTTRRLPALKATGTLAKDAASISNLATREAVSAVVMGIPFNPVGSGRGELICARLAELIRALGWEVHEVNEAMTSVEGAENLKAVYRKGGIRSRLDGEAAALILERFFDAQE